MFWIDESRRNQTSHFTQGIYIKVMIHFILFLISTGQAFGAISIQCSKHANTTISIVTLKPMEIQGPESRERKKKDLANRQRLVGIVEMGE